MEISSTPAHQVELIFFKNPTKARIFLPSIKWSKSEGELHQRLSQEFSKHGLVHHIHCYKKREDVLAAFVELYSQYSRDQAVCSLDNKLQIEDCCVRVLQSNRQRETLLPLSLHHCENLANYYFGFNNWSTELLYQEPEDTEVNGNKSIKQSFCSVVRVRVSLDGHQTQEVEGVGMADATFFMDSKVSEGRGDAFNVARKKSRGMALQNAFSKLIIVVVDGRKVGVEVDLSQVDSVLYDPLWERHEIDEAKFSGTSVEASWPFNDANLNKH